MDLEINKLKHAFLYCFKVIPILLKLILVIFGMWKEEKIKEDFLLHSLLDIYLNKEL